VLSIVVPTYNEAENIPELVARLQQVLQGLVYEIIIVDDNSPDETAAVCSALSSEFPLRLLQPRGRPRDLALSVVEGIRAAAFDIILVMDADLSHPPDKIRTMLKAIEDSPGVFVIGSRYIAEGSFDRQWSLWRFLNSHLATLMASPLTSCSDPMSGFFMFSRTRIDPATLNPIGYKIGLEILIRGEFDSIVEIPIRFKDRKIGQSKMDFNEQLKYLRHLRRLYLHRFGSFAELFLFGLVGASGFVVDILFYYLCQTLGASHLLARALSFWPAVSWNWALNRRVTFSERERRPRVRQWSEFVISSLMGFGINYGLYALLTTQVSFFTAHRLAALILGVAAASCFNFIASSLLVYSNTRN